MSKTMNHDQRNGLVPPVTSLGQLWQRAQEDDRYRRLAIAAARNLGCAPTTRVKDAIAWLRLNAQETDDEAGVVAEVNACRAAADLVE